MTKHTTVSLKEALLTDFLTLTYQNGEEIVEKFKTIYWILNYADTDKLTITTHTNQTMLLYTDNEFKPEKDYDVSMIIEIPEYNQAFRILGTTKNLGFERSVFWNDSIEEVIKEEFVVYKFRPLVEKSIERPWEDNFFS